MRTAKRTGIAALFAVFFALLLAGCLCLGLPAKREAQAAEGAVSEEEITYNDPSISGISTPAELMEAYSAAKAGDTIPLAGNIQLDMVNDSTITGDNPSDEGHLVLPIGVTFDLKGYTLNVIAGSKAPCCINIGQMVEGTEKTNATVTIKNGTLIGQSSGHFAIVQAGSTLNLSNVDVQFKKAEGDGQTTRPAAVAVNGRRSDAVAAILNVDNVMFSKLENAVPVFVGDLPSNQGTVNFTSDDPLTNLRDQINASSKDHQVETALTADITGSLVVPEYANITIDLNGYTITNTADKDTITNYGTLTIEDSSENDVGKVTNAGGSKAAIRNYGTASLCGGTYTRTVAEGATTSYYVIKNVGYMMIGSSTESGVKVTASDEYSSLIANGYYGDADKEAHVDKITADNACTMIINDGTFTGGMNVVKNDNEGVLTIHGGEFSTTCNESVLLNANSLTIYGGTFDASEARFAIRNQTGRLEIAKGDFKGEIYAPSQDVEITGGTFDRTFVSSYLAENASFYKQGGAFVVASEKPADAELIVAGLGAGNAAFTTLQAAIDAYKEGIADGTYNENYSISLYSDVTESVTVPVCTDSKGKVCPVSMNMYGHTLTAKDGSAAITVNGTFTWANEGIGTIVGEQGIVVDGGTLDVNKDVVFNCTTDITVKNGGAVTVSAGTFNGTTANFDVQDGTVTLTGGTYSHAIPQSVTLAENYYQIAQDGKYVVAQAIVMIEYTKDAQEVTEVAMEWKGALDRIGVLSQEGISEFAVTLLQRVGAGNTSTREETLTIPKGVLLTLDFNGKTANFNIENNGSLTLEGTENNGYYGELTNSGDLLILGGYYKDTCEGAIVNNGGTIKVRGGSFGGDDLGVYARNIAQFLDNGYCFTSIGTSSTAYAKVGEAEATASVQDGEGTYYFSTLSNASAYAGYHAESTSVTIRLLQDVEHGEPLTLGSASDVNELTLDFGGHTLTYTRFFSGNSYQSSTAIVFGRNGGADEKITVTNGKIVTDKAFDNGVEARKCFFIVQYNATLILDDVTVSYNGSSAPQNMVYVNQGTLNIKGGEYYGSIGVKDGANAEISGGTFAAKPDESYLAEGMAVYEVDGKYLVGDQNAVAVVKETGKAYTSLQDAITAAGESGGTVKLLKDVEINEAITIRSAKTLSFDLNGKKITGGDIKKLFTISATSVTFGNGTIEAENQVFEITGGTGLNGKTVTFKDDLSISSKNEVAVFIYQSITLNTSAKITAKNAAIMGNGTDTKYAKINVTGGEITSTNAVAMYLPAKSAVVTISGGVVTGTTGIEVRGGTLNIKDGAKIVATGETLVAHREGGGASVLSGAAVAVSKYASSNSLKVNITGGTLKGLYAFYEAELNATQSEVTGLTLSITGGTYNGEVYSENLENFIEGGDFNTVFPSAYLAENAVLVKTTDGFKALDANGEAAKAYVAEVSDPDAETAVRYQTLAAAITAAKDGDTVKLCADVPLTEALTIDKSVTIDLAGHTINAPATAANITANATIKSSVKGGTIKHTGKVPDHGLIITNDATLTLESVTVDYEGAGQAVKLGTFKDGKPTEKSGNAVLNGVTVKGGQAGVIVLGTQKDSEYGASLTVTNSNISGTIYYGIVNNGMGYNTSITLENTKVSAPVKSGTAMYLPGEGETTITGGTITGATGIEIRAGKLTINEGTIITATGDYEEPVANPSGTTVGGVAVAVSQHTTQLAINVAITGGTFNATGKDGKAFLEIDTVEKEDAEPSEGVTASITGGAFDASVEARNITGFIKGGAFSEMPKMDYFAENYIAQFNAETGKYETKEGSWVAAIGEEGYASLQDAINAAEDGETIILRADIGSADTPATAGEIVVDKAGAEITLDLKGKSIYVTNGYNDVNNGLKFINLKAGTLSIINSEEGGGVISASGRAFQIVPEEKVEAKLVLGKGVKVHAVGGPAVFIMPDGAANVSDGSAYYAVLESAADLSTDSTYGAIQGNGTAHGTFITINGGTLSSQGNVIYHPQYGKLVINGGTFESPIAGVEVRAGELIVNGGKFNIGGTFKCEYNGNGATIEGAAIAVSQHTTDLPLEFTIAGGTFNSDADGKAFYQAATISENTAPVTGEIKGGEFNGEVGAATLTGFIEGGDFGVKPADKLMNEGYAAEYVNGRYVAVPSTALQEARLAAQADVRAYAAAKGIDWSQIEAAAEDESAVEAQLVLTTYNAIAEAMSTLAVAEAKLDAMAALDLYDAAAAAALAETKQGYIDDLKKLAAGDEATDEDDIILPTATYFAINSAATAEEALFYYKNAKAEIADIRAYRGEIAAQAEELETLAAAIAAIDGGLFGTEDAQGAIKDIQDAIAAAQEAITNGDETTSASLKQIYDYLNGTLKSAVDGISRMLTDAVSEGGILHEMQTTLKALDATVNGDGTEDPALLDKLTAAIEAAQNAINNNTATEMGEAVEKITAAITAAQEVIIAALPDYEETLGEIAGSVDKLEELLGGTNGLVAIKKGIDNALAAIGTADGDTTLFEQLAAIESGNTAIKTTVDDLAAALTGKDGAIATLTAALTAMQGDITKLTGALAEDTGWVAKDIAAAQAEIDKLTAAVGKLGTVDGKDLAAVVGEIADGLEEMDATVNSIASTVSAASAVEEAKTQAAADIRTWLEGYLEELAGDTAQADVLARAAYTAETTEGELYKDISAQFGEENGKLVLKYYNEALAAIDAATTVSDVTTAVATFRAQVASIEASAGNSTDLTVVYVLLGVVLLVLIIACIVALVKGGRKPEPAPAQAAPAEKPAEAQPEEKAEEKEEQAEEAAPAEEPAGETAPAEEESAAAEDDDKERVVISANVRTFDEAYEDLTDEQRELFNKVKEYALAKEDAVEVKQSGGVVIKRKSKQIVKLTVRRDMPVALFLLENEMLKDFRRNAKSEAKLKVRATELVIREADDLETAYTMVDLSVEQIEKDLEAAKERRREARRQRRLQRQAEEAAAEQAEGAEEPAPADEPASAESAATDGTDTE